MTRVETDGTGPASFGVVEVTPVGGTSSFSGALTYSIFGTFVSVGNSPARSSQRVFISVNPDPVLGEDTGLALYNPSASQSATLQLVLRDDFGDRVETRDNLVIGPRQQLLGFVTESAFFRTFFDAHSGSFLGTVEITVTSGPDVAVLGLLQKTQAFNHALVSVAASGNRPGTLPHENPSSSLFLLLTFTAKTEYYLHK